MPLDPPKLQRAERFVKAVRVDELHEGQGRVIEVGHKRVAVFKYDGVYHCIQNTCPHAGGSLGRGDFDEGIVRCPRHYWGFDVRTGQCTTQPLYCLKRYPTRLEDGWVYVGVPDDGRLI